MAKYCIKCGKALPEGVEICPDCNVSSQPGNDAALFTMMTAETEVWKDSGEEERRQARAKLLRSNKKKIAIISGSALLLAVAVFLGVFFQPSAVVARALNKGEYERARSIYSEKLYDSEPSGQVCKALSKAAQSILDSYSRHEIDEAQAKSAMGSLTAFGDFTHELLGDTLLSMEELYDSQNRFGNAELLFQAGDYLAACVNFMAVAQGDSLYEQAQEKVQECFDAYSREILSQAGAFIIEDDYISAIKILREGDAKLQELDTFSQSIDDKLAECTELYFSRVMTEAKEKADALDYYGAAEVIRVCVVDHGFSNDELIAAMENYILMGDEKIANDAIAKGFELYDGMHYADAFQTLDSALESLPEGNAYDTLAASISDMEEQFVDDMLAAADEIYGGDRANLPDAIAKMERAYAIRELSPIKEKGEELEQYLPFELVNRDYFAKEGEIFRSNTDFESLADIKFKNWLWGRNESSVSFKLDGKYDVFEAVFAIRRESEDEPMTGWFELWCDGELVYTAEELSHESEELAVAVSVDVKGVQEMKIVFFCDYESSSAENGYSYHGLCRAEALKNQ